MALLLSTLPLTASAYDFMTDGVCYNINDDGTSVTATYEHFPSESQCYLAYDSLNGVLTIPASVVHNGITYPVKSIDYGAFYGCNLTDIDIPNSITSIGADAFERTPWFNNQPNGLVYAGRFAYKYKGQMPIETSIILDAGCTGIADGAFSNCFGLVSITIPNSVISIGHEAFKNCRGLTSIDIPNSVVSIGEMAFSNCNTMTSIVLPNSLTSIGPRAFYCCRSLSSITIPSSVISIGSAAFSNCTGLTSIDFKNTIIGEAQFLDCTALNSITIPDPVVSIGNEAFKNCTKLISVSIPKSVTSIGYQIFAGCTGIESIIVESGNNVYDSRENCNAIIETVNNNLLYACKNTTIPMSVTSIGERAFSICSAMTNIAIPTSVTSIGNYAFSGCSGIKKLILCGDGDFQLGQPLEISSSSYTLYIMSGITGITGLKLNPTAIYTYAIVPPRCDANSFTKYTATLHVLENSTVAYATADYWTNFLNLNNDVVAAPQSVTLSRNDAEIELGETLTLNATVNPSNATPNTLNWATSNSAVATVDNNGKVTAVGYGECDITVKALDKTAVCHITVPNRQVVITLDMHQLTIDVNQIAYLTPSMSPTNTDLVVECSDNSVVIARLVGNRVQVIGAKPGVATVTVSSVDGDAQPDECVVTVNSNGDVNGDGFVTVTDVTSLAAIIIGDVLIGNNEKNWCDLNNDDIVNVSDLTILISKLLE